MPTYFVDPLNKYYDALKEYSFKVKDIFTSFKDDVEFVKNELNSIMSFTNDITDCSGSGYTFFNNNVLSDTIEKASKIYKEIEDVNDSTLYKKCIDLLISLEEMKSKDETLDSYLLEIDKLKDKKNKENDLLSTIIKYMPDNETFTEDYQKKIEIIEEIDFNINTYDYNIKKLKEELNSIKHDVEKNIDNLNKLSEIIEKVD